MVPRGTAGVQKNNFLRSFFRASPRLRGARTHPPFPANEPCCHCVTMKVTFEKYIDPFIPHMSAQNPISTWLLTCRNPNGMKACRATTQPKPTTAIQPNSHTARSRNCRAKAAASRQSPTAAATTAQPQPPRHSHTAMHIAVHSRAPRGRSRAVAAAAAVPQPQRQPQPYCRRNHHTTSIYTHIYPHSPIQPHSHSRNRRATAAARRSSPTARAATAEPRPLRCSHTARI